MQDLFIVTWTARILCPIVISFQMWLLRRIWNKRQIEIERETSDTYHVWLDRLSLASVIMFTISICVHFVSTFSSICEYISFIYPLTWGYGMILISLYQIIRLQLCFSVNFLYNYPT